MSKCIKCETENKLDAFDKCLKCIQYALSKPDIIVSNALAYANSYRHGASRLKIQQACIKHFSDKDLENASKSLYGEYEFILGESPIRWGGVRQTKSKVHME